MWLASVLRQVFDFQLLVSHKLEYATIRTWITLGISIATTLCLSSYAQKRWRRHALPLPPGPPGKLLIGNLHDIPVGEEQWRDTVS